MVLICIILFCPVVCADTISEIFGKKFLDFAYDLDISTIYIPDKQEQAHKHIKGWVDIVGYENMTCIDGMYYIPGPPVEHAIIKYNVWDQGLFWNDNLDYIEITDTRIFSDGDNTTVEIDIHLLWHHSVKKSRTTCGTNGCRTHTWISKTYYHEYATFSDTDVPPLIFTPLNVSNTSVDVVIYNNTISPKTTFRVLNVPDNTFSIDYTYDNETIIHYLSTATQEYTNKNCPYMQINSTNVWKDYGNLSQFNGFAIVPHMIYSETNLTVTLNSPYGAHEIDNSTVYEQKWHGAKDSFSSLFFLFVGILGILLIGSWIQIRRLRCH